MHGRCVGGARKVVEGTRKLHRRCTEGAREVRGRCNANDLIGCGGNPYPMRFILGARKVCERCEGGAQKVCRRCVGGVWKVHGRCTEGGGRSVLIGQHR